MCKKVTHDRQRNEKDMTACFNCGREVFQGYDSPTCEMCDSALARVFPICRVCQRPLREHTTGEYQECFAKTGATMYHPRQAQMPCVYATRTEKGTYEVHYPFHGMDWDHQPLMHRIPWHCGCTEFSEQEFADKFTVFRLAFREPEAVNVEPVRKLAALLESSAGVPTEMQQWVEEYKQLLKRMPTELRNKILAKRNVC